MKLEEFKIGETFFASAGFEWLCTDKGTRTITAIMLDPDKDDSWFVGPPYAVEEVVFDENDMKSCHSNTENLILDRIENSEISSHPGFFLEDVSKMMKAKVGRDKYPRKKILRRDRVNQNGEILHPYVAEKKDNGWHIKTFELFSKKYSEMHEDEFVNLPLSNEEAIRNRKKNFKELSQSEK